MAQGHILDANTLALWRFNNPKKGERRYIWDHGPNGFTAVSSTLSLAGIIRPFGPAKQAVRQSIGGAAFGDAPQTRHDGTINATVVAALKSSCTFEMFVMPMSSADSRTVFSIGSSNNQVMRIDLRRAGGTSRLGAFWEVSTVDQTIAFTAGAGMADDVWYHAAIVKDNAAGEMRFYINGVHQETLAKPAEATATGAQVLTMFSNIGVNLGLRACVKDIKISNVAKSAPDLVAAAALLNTTFELPVDGNTLALWRCDDDADIIFDEGNNLPLYFGRALEEPRLAKGLIDDGGQCAQFFDKVAQSLPISDNTGGHGYGAYVNTFRLALQQAFTFEAWIDLAGMINSGGSNASPIIGGARGVWVFGDPGLVPANVNYLGVTIRGNRTVEWWSEYSADTDSVVASTAQVPATGPFHLALRRNTAVANIHTVDMFVNGVHVDTLVGIRAYEDGSATSQQLQLGYGSYESAGYFRGYIDDVRFSNVARSDDEILESYLRGISDGGPTLTVVSPAIGSELASSDTVTLLSAPNVDTVDEITINFGGAGGSVVVWDGSSWATGFSTSELTNVDGDVTIELRADDGWEYDVASVVVEATDLAADTSTRTVGSWPRETDDSAPVVEIVSPSVGAQPGQPGGFPENRRLAEETPVVIRIYDVAPGLRYEIVTVTVPTKVSGSTVNVEEVVYRLGSFRGRHIKNSTQRVFTQVIDEREVSVLELSIRRAGGWPSVTQLKFSVDAVDETGNLGG